VAQIKLHKNSTSVLSDIYLPLTGGTMSGDIVMNENDISDIGVLHFNLTAGTDHVHEEGSLH